MVNFSFSEWVLFFLLYSAIGWLLESIWCSVEARKPVNRGFLSGPWCPVYGFGALVILILAMPCRQYPWLVFPISLLSAAGLEYFTGWLLEALFKTRWWDYSSQRVHIKGRICLFNSFLFGVMGLASVYILQPLLSGLLSCFSSQTQWLLSSLAIIFFFFDLIRSLAVAARLQERLVNLRDAIHTMEAYQHTHQWYDREDLAGSIARLREICAADPDNAMAAGILGELDRQLVEGLVHSRLLKAFPGLLPRAFFRGFDVFRQERGVCRQGRRLRCAQKKTRRRERLSAAKGGFFAVYREMTVSRMVWIFLMSSCLGFVIETLFCMATRGVVESRQGMVYGPFNQVYGFGALFMILLLAPLARKGDLFTFIGGGVIGGLFEVGCSAVQEALLGTVSWEYSEQQFSLFGGRTSLLYMFFWGVLAVVFMKFMYPWMLALVNRVPKRARLFCTWVIAVVLCVDLLLSAVAVIRWSARVASEPAKNAMEIWLDEYYPNEELQEIYPNMQFRASRGS